MLGSCSTNNATWRTGAFARGNKAPHPAGSGRACNSSRDGNTYQTSLCESSAANARKSLSPQAFSTKSQSNRHGPQNASNIYQESASPPWQEEIKLPQPKSAPPTRCRNIPSEAISPMECDESHFASLTRKKKLLTTEGLFGAIPGKRAYIARRTWIPKPRLTSSSHKQYRFQPPVLSRQMLIYKPICKTWRDSRRPSSPAI